MEEPEALLTARQTARLLGLHPKTLYRFARARRIASVRIARGMLRFRPADVRAWIAALTVGPAQQSRTLTQPAVAPRLRKPTRKGRKV
jgi:excisionase family DNA binding protein